MRYSGRGLQELVIGAALALAAAVLFYSARGWLNRYQAPEAAPGPAAPARIASDYEQPMPGASPPRRAPIALPPLVIRKASRASPSVGGKQEPPAPVIPGKKKQQ